MHALRMLAWRPPLDAIRARCPLANIWRQQMGLGPAMEFAVDAPADAQIEVPPGWQARPVNRGKLT